MEEDQEAAAAAASQKHVCKFCNKRFACGRSLGGHMRSHMMNNYEPPPAADVDKKKKLHQNQNSSSSMVDFESLNSHTTTTAGYGLRENPRKTWRISAGSSMDDVHGGKLCKQCGKGFQSWKALFGHMRCHSEKDKVFESFDEEDEDDQEDSWLVMDSQSDNNEEPEPEEAPKMRRSSRRSTRYKNGTTNSTTTCSLSNFPNASSSVSDQIEQNQQEQVAMSLMMLSRDVGNCLVESSDNNNSVLLEARSSLGTKAANNKNLFNENVKKSSNGKQKLRLRSRVSEPEAAVGFEKKGSKVGGYDQSESLRIGVKKVESDASVGKHFGDVEFKKSRKLDNKAEIEVFDVELERNSNKKHRGIMKSTRAELGKNLTNERSDLKHGINKEYNSSNHKRAKLTDSYDRESEVVSYKKVTYEGWGTEIRSKSSKKNKFKCMTCNKTFHSYQALGGHRASHKRIKGCFASKIQETSENSIETEVSHDPTADSKLVKETPIESEVTGSTAETSYGVLKKNKHECPICFKVFSSGQALGGHKRSHGLGGASDQLMARSSINVVHKQVQPEVRDLLDLNLPAPGEEDDAESDGDVGYEPWWVGSTHNKHKSLVGLISN